MHIVSRISLLAGVIAGTTVLVAAAIVKKVRS